MKTNHEVAEDEACGDQVPLGTGSREEWTLQIGGVLYDGEPRRPRHEGPDARSDGDAVAWAGHELKEVVFISG